MSSKSIVNDTWLMVEKDKAGIYTVSRPDYVAILPVKRYPPITVYLAQQARRASSQRDKNILNLIQGAIDPGESPSDAALRELAEEAGLSGELLPVGTFDLNPAFMKCCCHLYLAINLTKLSNPPINPDPDEIKIHSFTLADAKSMVEKGQIRDVMTALAITHCCQHFHAA